MILMLNYVSTVSVFEQKGQAFILSWQAQNMPQMLAYEIEDEYGRIIKGSIETTKDFTLPKLGVGYYHLRLLTEDDSQDSLLIISPQKAYETQIRIKPQTPINSLKQLRQVLQEKSDLHYLFPFPRFADLAAIYRLHMFAENNNAVVSEYALFLALKKQYKINRDFQDWCNRCYDFNKINSYKCKEFARQNQKSIKQAAGIIAEVQTYLQKSKNYLHRQNCKVISYLSMLTAADYQSFEGWQNKKMLLNKPCRKNKSYVPYDSQMLRDVFYHPIIEKIRIAMLGADFLMIEDFETLEQNICEDFPFPDKKEKYDTDALLAILKIESRRSQCAIMATTTSELSADFLAQSQNSGIIFCEQE